MNSILHYRSRRAKPFATFFPQGTSLLALDLISKMLQFHPDDRISVENALDHPYLSEYHVQMPEPICNNLFNFEFEKVNYDLTSEDVQLLMYDEMLLYRPTATHFPSYQKSSALLSSSFSSSPPQCQNQSNSNSNSNSNINSNLNSSSNSEKSKIIPSWGIGTAASEERRGKNIYLSLFIFISKFIMIFCIDIYIYFCFHICFQRYLYVLL